MSSSSSSTLTYCLFISWFTQLSTLDGPRTRCDERPRATCLPHVASCGGCGVVVVDERTDGVWVLTWNLNWSCFLVIEMECTVPPYVDKFKLTLI
jgi:hypothetical protein